MNTNSEVTKASDQAASNIEELLNRLRKFESLPPLETKESKHTVWVEFLEVWTDILHYSPVEAETCYHECVKLATKLSGTVGFNTLKNDPINAVKYCSIALKQLKEPNLREYLKMPMSEEKTKTNTIYISHCVFIFWYFSQAIMFLPRVIDDEKKFFQDHQDLIMLMIDRIDRSMPIRLSNAAPASVNVGQINRYMLSILWNISDRTVTIPLLIECGLVKHVVSWLEQADRLDQTSRTPLISLVHNISRHDEGADRLNEFNIIPLIKRYQELIKEKQHSRLVIGYMALALISTPEQIKQDRKGMNTVLNQLLQLAMDAGKNDRFRSGGFHVSEPLAVLVKLFVVEERTLDYVLCHAETQSQSDMISTINFFTTLLIRSVNNLQPDDLLAQFSVIALFNIIWSISFQPQYTDELKKNQTMIDLVVDIAKNKKQLSISNQYKPRSMEDFQHAVGGILHNLNLADREEEDSTKNQIAQKQFENARKPSIMISYSHMDDQFCTHVLENLKVHKDLFDVWIDRTHCQGATDPWELIAEGMEHASLIVTLLSNQYFESKSCRQEFIYAVGSLKKVVVPVIIGNFEPKGWLGIRMSMLKYIRFRDSNSPDPQKMQKLTKLILSEISSNTVDQAEAVSMKAHNHNDDPDYSVVSKQLSSPSNNASASGTAKKNDDIAQWFTTHNISYPLYELFDFQNMEEMTDYADLLQNDRDQQMHIYSKLYSQKYPSQQLPPHEFIRFSRAMAHLVSNKRPNTVISMNAETAPAQQKSRTCTVL